MKIILNIALFVFVSAHAVQISTHYFNSDSSGEIESIVQCDGCGPDRGGRDRDRGDRGGRGGRDR